MSLFRRKPKKDKTSPPRVDPHEMKRIAEQSLKESTANQPIINRLTSWLNTRNEENGFGRDFDVTVIAKEV